MPETTYEWKYYARWIYTRNRFKFEVGQYVLLFVMQYSHKVYIISGPGARGVKLYNIAKQTNKLLNISFGLSI